MCVGVGVANALIGKLLVTLESRVSRPPLVRRENQTLMGSQNISELSREHRKLPSSCNFSPLRNGLARFVTGFYTKLDISA